MLVQYDGWSEKWNEWVSMEPNNFDQVILEPIEHERHDGSGKNTRLVLEVVVDGKSYKTVNLSDGKTVFLDQETGCLLWHPPLAPSSANLTPDVELPEGWIKRQDSSGDPYFFNSVNWKAQWTEPRLSGQQVATNMKRARDPIPSGWEIFFDRDGNPYYYNTITSETVWEIDEVNAVDPKASESAAASGEPPAIPEGWEIYFTEEGVAYFYCTETKTSHWEIPDGVGSLSMDISSGNSNPFEDEQKGKRLGNRKK